MTTNSNQKLEPTRETSQTRQLSDRQVIIVRLEEANNNKANSLDLSASFGDFIWSKIREYLQIVEKQALLTKLNRNKVCTTTHTKHTITSSDHKSEKTDSNKADNQDSLISFF